MCSFINNKEIEQLIKHGYESDYLDFKSIQYTNTTNLIKDIMSMANSFSSQTKYIIIGIKTTSSNEKKTIGIIESEFKDSSEYQQLIYANIEPDLHIEYLPYKYNGILLGILRIDNSDDKPYILKKDSHLIKKGLCYVRKGSQQMPATRADYDRFYFMKEEIGVAIKDYSLFVSGDNALARSQVLFKNYSKNPTTIMGGKFEIYDKEGKRITTHNLLGFDKEYLGEAFSLELKNKSERFGEAYFSFSSSDCLRLNMDSFGFVDNLTAKITVWDSGEREYSHTVSDFSVIVKGKALWKVELREKKQKKRRL